MDDFEDLVDDVYIRKSRLSPQLHHTYPKTPNKLSSTNNKFSSSRPLEYSPRFSSMSTSKSLNSTKSTPSTYPFKSPFLRKVASSLVQEKDDLSSSTLSYDKRTEETMPQTPPKATQTCSMQSSSALGFTISVPKLEKLDLSFDVSESE
ncbi:hypothetical protein P9112_011569 [Eukaryota sp. TZLM1-RC]